MKRLILTALTYAAIASSALISCNNSSKSSKKKNISITNEDSIKANGEYLLAVEHYKKLILKMIVANKRSIGDLKVRIEGKKKEERADHSRQVTIIEQLNTDQQKRINEYTADDKEGWILFKAGFDLDMYELEKDLRDMDSSLANSR